MVSSASVGDGFEMPSYNVRNSIANKMAAKKTAKGYTLSEANCDMCEMPLMTLNGKSECKVCPAIKKWVQRQNESNVQVDEREAVESFEEDDAAEVRDDPPLEPPSMDIESSKSCESYDNHLMKVNSTDSTESSRGISTSGSDESEASENTEAIRARARQIILNARNKGGWGTANSNDEDSDDEDVKSAQLSGISSSWESNSEDVCVYNRAEEIIKLARMNLKAEEDVSEDPPEAEESPRLSMNYSSTSMNQSLGDVPSAMGSWDAAIIVQSVVRMYLSRKLFIGMMLRESIKEPIVVEEAPQKYDSFGINNTSGDESWEQEAAEENFIDDHQEPQEPEETGKAWSGEVEEYGDVAPIDAPQYQVASDTSDGVVEGVIADDVVADTPQDVTVFDCVEETVPDPTSEYEKSNADNPSPRPALSGINSLVDDSNMAPHQQYFQYQSATDYGVVLQNQEDQPPNIPKRGFFAGLACKFDDAVMDAMGKVQAVVTCSAMVEPGNYASAGGLAEAFEAEQFKMDNSVMFAASSEVQSQQDEGMQDKYNEQIKAHQQQDLFVDQAPPQTQYVNDYHFNHHLQMGWIALDQGCPYCSSQLMKSLNGPNHCLACGPILSQQVVNADAAPPAVDANPFSALGDFTAVNNSVTPMTVPANPAIISQVQQPVHDRQYDFDPRVESAPTPTEHQIAVANQALVMQNTAHIQNQLQSMQIDPPMRPEWEQDADDGKENSAGDPNVSKQLNEARMRIEDAKKFILSRTRTRVPPTSSLQSMQMYNSGDHLQVFRPHTSMMTPVSNQVAGQPMVTSYTPGAQSVGNCGPQTYLVTSPVRAPPTPEMRVMGSLMSPGTDSNDNVLEKMAQVGTEPPMSEMTHSEHDGYRTPQMPGKYFFA